MNQKEETNEQKTERIKKITIMSFNQIVEYLLLNNFMQEDEMLLEVKNISINLAEKLKRSQQSDLEEPQEPIPA